MLSIFVTIQYNAEYMSKLTNSKKLDKLIKKSKNIAKNHNTIGRISNAGFFQIEIKNF
jgi:hypothetical protein